MDSNGCSLAIDSTRLGRDVRSEREILFDRERTRRGVDQGELTDGDRMQVDRLNEMREKSALNAQEIPGEDFI